MQRFVVGTGRCGSTLLSRMLAEHPDALSISEFFSTVDRAGVFADGLHSGAQLSAFLDRNNILNDLVIARAPYFDAAAAHGYRPEVPEYAREHRAVPAMQMLLAQFGEDPEALYRELRAFAMARPVQSLAQHYLDLFDWLRLRYGRALWIERSGVSLEFMPILRRWYPQARFLHIHRDGPTTALAIRAFRHFVLYGSFFFHPPTEDEIRQALQGPIDPANDPILRRMATEMPSLADFGTYWSWQIAVGCREFAALAPAQFLDLRYEDLVGDTVATLARIAAFFDLPAHPRWLERAAALIDTEVTPDRLSDLPAAQRRALDAACLPGQVLLGRSTANPFAAAMATARAAAVAPHDRIGDAATLSCRSFSP
jgi:hypothetical protein